jgi:hypothetical protein
MVPELFAEFLLLNLLYVWPVCMRVASLHACDQSGIDLCDELTYQLWTKLHLQRHSVALSFFENASTYHILACFIVILFNN